MIDSLKALDLLGNGSPLAQDIEAFERREGQEQMIEAICDALNRDRFAVIEAGTGIGKSFAYLIPLVLAASEMEGEHFVVSTGTINLQYQLYEKDLPFLCSRIDPTVSTALLMGRSNYLCIRRLLHEADARPMAAELEEDPLSRVILWARETERGIRSEIPQRIPQEVWSQVCSDGDFCFGFHCPARGECFLQKARKAAAQAQIIVINHHVLFADVSLKLEGDSFDEDGLLPAYSRVVCDEAHKIEEGARSYFTEQVSRGAVMKLLSQLWNSRRGSDDGVLQKLRGYSSDPDAWELAASAIEEITQYIDALERDASALLGGQRKLWMNSREASRWHQMVHTALQTGKRIDQFLQLCVRIEQSLDSEDERISYTLNQFKGYCSKLVSAASVLQRLHKFDQEGASIFWLEQRGRGQVSFLITPHSPAELLRESLFSHLDSLIAVSATLTVNHSFAHWRESLGLDEIPVDETIAASPFDYRSNVLLGVPTDAPPVERIDEYAQYLKRSLLEIITLSEGRTLVLFTSFSLLKDISSSLEEPLRKAGITSLVQLPGSDRAKLLNTFKQQPGRVLFATDSFWEGVDVPGDALQQVVITRLPFQVPVDPVYLARQERITSRGGNPFMELALPRAAMKLKQGFGRLIRRTGDRGVVLVLDNRLLTKFYGKMLIKSLPETTAAFTDQEGLMRRIESFLFP